MQQIETPAERLAPLVSAMLQPSTVDAFKVFSAPGYVIGHPRDEVLIYPGLSTADKRIVLASWTSDARAAESCPTLRCLPGYWAEPVPLDAILTELQAPDEGLIDRL
ncbi:conserved hypothetical protein [Methylorubrum populi BJ001]|jgi:hypothetical protein|uniref:Uncharacterized protein n=1 Tax=Methylorubrum populi (strain ATCC BAA-705 / NCIMB 13946 / BJ001) TaxID=441620 RepID=B1Z7M5_METPB|nr:hypothetical protein [Methylorubrum populi]ACB81828.1 conserved hypothetical protein [Methylorubrum populi BJ001]